MNRAPLDRAWIAAHLPHQGNMSLLHEILEWDATTVHARAASHRAADNPLRRAGELPIACGVEYGAQAAAAHGALMDGRASGAGLLVAARSVVFHARRLDDVPGDLDVFAERIGGSDAGVMYRFEVTSAGRPLVEGRVTVAFAR